jgi:acyl carrier protein
MQTASTDFETRLSHFLNHDLPLLDRRKRTYPTILGDTQLFDTGLIDSLSILHLLAFIEQEIGSAVPDSWISPLHFRTPQAIVNLIRDGAK